MPLPNGKAIVEPMNDIGRSPFSTTVIRLQKGLDTSRITYYCQFETSNQPMSLGLSYNLGDRKAFIAPLLNLHNSKLLLTHSYRKCTEVRGGYLVIASWYQRESGLFHN